MNVWAPAALLVAVVVGSVVLTIWFIFFTDAFLVQSITVLDARPHTTTAVRQAVESHLPHAADSRWFRTVFFVPVASLESKIMTTIPQVRTVHITRVLPGTIKVVIQEKTPALLLLASGKYYLVDQEGIAYEEARLDTLPGTVLPTVKTNDQGAQVTIGGPVVSQSFVGFVQTVQEKIPGATGGQAAEIRIPSLAAREVSFRLDNNWEIRFDVTRPAQTQLDTLKRLLDTSIPPEEKAALEYIDLRIANRVYYKTRLNTP